MKWEVLDKDDRVLDRLKAEDPQLLYALRLGFRIRRITDPRLVVVVVGGGGD